MAIIYFFQNIIFNILFYGACLFFSLIYLPALFMPKKIYIVLLHIYFWSLWQIEKYILGLDFEVRGRENIPTQGAYLVAAKHQSAYETLKLHLLFGDPAVILKRELYHIPLWGWHAAKSDMIAIDRSRHKEAIKMIINGAQEKLSAGRPVVIFPQGTRVSVDTTIKEKPYKSGIMRIYEASNVPLVPMALNTGLYWPRNSFFKKPGKIILSIMPPIPAGLPPEEVEKTMIEQIETETHKLVKEGREMQNQKKKSVILPAIIIVALLAYTGAWFTGKNIISKTLNGLQEFSEVRIDGFPAKYNATAKITTEELSIPVLKGNFWPLPATQAYFAAPEGFNYTSKKGTVTAKDANVALNVSKWPQNLTNEALYAWALTGPQIIVQNAKILFDDSEVSATGSFICNEEGIPQGSALISLKNYDHIVEKISALGFLDRNQKNIIISLLQFYSKGQAVAPDTITLTLRIEQRNLMIGPFTVAYLEEGPVFWGVKLASPYRVDLDTIEIPEPVLPPEVQEHMKKLGVEPPAPQQ
ncbi:MAG: DUF2125 domain-containing protein [Alphaproteobacteria bacterium]|nr:DUF2125 domain-containing protein [Alphaproteobacteria bacterium]